MPAINGQASASARPMPARRIAPRLSQNIRFMNIAIIGAGIIGVTTAYELAADGHQVTVFERHASVAEEASFAPAGLLAPCTTAPFLASHPGQSRWRQLLSQQAIPQLRRPFSRADAAWRRQLRRTTEAPAFGQDLAGLMRLALFSRARMEALTERLDYDLDRSSGSLWLLRGERERELARPELERLRALDIPWHEISADEAQQIEPALHTGTPLAGAIHFPQDAVGNCRQFAIIVRDAAERLGARFAFNTLVAGIQHSQNAIVTIADGEKYSFEAVIVCAGSAAAELLSPLGVPLAMRPIWGYSISAAIPETVWAPRSAVVDRRHQVCISRMGQRVRVAGGAEVGGRADSINDNAVELLYKVLADWFPAAARLSSGVQTWKGARPTLASGLPMIGPSGVPRIWVNIGHGGQGWSLACGAARWLADQVAENPS